MATIEMGGGKGGESGREGAPAGPAGPPGAARGAASAFGAARAFLETLGAALLAGGLAATAIFAQVAFRSVPEVLTREQAGLLAGRTFEIFLWVEIACWVLVAVGSLGRRTAAKQVALLVIMASLLGHILIGQRMRSLRHEAGGSIERVARDHPIRQEFGRLHAAYVGASAAMLAGALAVLGANARKAAAA